MKRSFILLASLLAASGAAAQTVSDKAHVRFVAAGDLAGGVYRAAIVIDLAPDTLTYWRNPGDAGVPPTFDWKGSQNVAKAVVAMPAPKRITEAGEDVFGYTGQVAYPVTITPADPGKPVSADLRMDYAACEKICIPMHADASLTFAPDGKAGPDAPLVAAALAATPKAAAAADAAKITPVAGAPKPTWRVEPKAAGASDLFAEAPDGYFFETGKEPDGAFRLTMAEATQAAPGLVPVRLTMPTAAGAIEFEVGLDAAGHKP
ncbi:MAG: hypothetical protein KGM42_08770 [Hyphomicrobiales bacterium]|nr:hypothetical protein [Hyphomicrobiales bacterium]